MKNISSRLLTVLKNFLSLLSFPWDVLENGTRVKETNGLKNVNLAYGTDFTRINSGGGG